MSNITNINENGNVAVKRDSQLDAEIRIMPAEFDLHDEETVKEKIQQLLWLSNRVHGLYAKAFSMYGEKDSITTLADMKHKAIYDALQFFVENAIIAEGLNK